MLHSLELALAKGQGQDQRQRFLPSGLVEMTRKRTRESLEHVLCAECPECKGRGRVKTVESVCFEILREIIRVNRAYDADQFTVSCGPSVADYLRGRSPTVWRSWKSSSASRSGWSPSRSVGRNSSMW